MADSAAAPLPLFWPNENDVYVRPKPPQLASYKWSDNPVFYRTGVVCSNDGLMRFLCAEDDGDFDVHEVKFHFNKKLFKAQQFRVRLDLQPGSRCFDSEESQWCQIVSIDDETGGVRVRYDREEEEKLISADPLHGVSLNSQVKVIRNPQCEDIGNIQQNNVIQDAEIKQEEESLLEETLSGSIEDEEAELASDSGSESNDSTGGYAWQRKKRKFTGVKIEDISDTDIEVSSDISLVQEEEPERILGGHSSRKDTEGSLNRHGQGAEIESPVSTQICYDDDGGNGQKEDEGSELENSTVWQPKKRRCSGVDLEESRNKDKANSNGFEGSRPARAFGGQAGSEDMAVEDPNFDCVCGDGERRNEGKGDGHMSVDDDDATSLPAFEVKESDPYVKPKVGELVSFQYHPNEFRVGVVYSQNKSGGKTRYQKVRFFDAYENGQLNFQTVNVYVTREWFRRGQFRARPELKPQCRCYDAELRSFCTLNTINKSFGSVCVQYDGEDEVKEIAPDNLVVAPDTESAPHEPDDSQREGTLLEFGNSRERGASANNQTEDPSGSDAMGLSAVGNTGPATQHGDDGEKQVMARAETISVAASETGAIQEAGNHQHATTADEITVLAEDNMVVRPEDGEQADERKTPHDNHVAGRDNSGAAKRSSGNGIDGNQPLRFEGNWYYGVYTHKEQDEEGRKWYIRGKLRNVVGSPVPIIIKGESIKYVAGGEVETIERLEFDVRRCVYKEVVSSKDKKQCERCGKLAEKEHASDIRKTRKRNDRNTNFCLRPLQPVLVLGLGNAVVAREPDRCGDVEVTGMGRDKAISTHCPSKIRLFGYVPDPVDLESFWRANNPNLPRQNQIFSKPADFLLEEWRSQIDYAEFEHNFELRKMERIKMRKRANGSGDGARLTPSGVLKMQEHIKKLHLRLQEDYKQENACTQEGLSGMKSLITKIKLMFPHPNFLLLCGGFAPEVAAYKRLNVAPIGKVILQDTDLHAVGVAVAANPDVEFCIVVKTQKSTKQTKRQIAREPGDVRILTDPAVVRELEVIVGGIHHSSVTNPCQSFSLAGQKDGFGTQNGLLLWDCCDVVRHISGSSAMPTYFFENVPSTHEINERFNTCLQDANKFFIADASMCSPCRRKRKFATNVPPPVCSVGSNKKGNPPSLDGNQPELCAQSIVSSKMRMLHPDLKKMPCLMHSNPTRDACIWEQNDIYEDPVPTTIQPEEAERAMGYREDELGVTSFSAEKAVRKRINEHDSDVDGCLVSLKGCAEDPECPLEAVSPRRRLELLGNSECVTLLEAFMWREQELFPPIESGTEGGSAGLS